MTTTATTKSGLFLPFWELMGVVFVWNLFLEFLGFLGLKQNQKKK